MAEAAAIVLAAGSGQRMGPGHGDKVWADLGGSPVLRYTLAAFQRAAAVHAIVLVTREDLRARSQALIAQAGLTKVQAVVDGGATRRESTRNGLAVLAGGRFDVVTVHDAARPFIDDRIIAEGVALAREHGAAIPVIPVSDTIKQVSGSAIVGSPPREHLRAAQTPQAFRLDLLIRAHESADDAATDDGVLVERLGYTIRAYPGSPRNIKITVAEDLLFARALLAT